VREQTSSLGYSAQFASWLSLHRDELITLLDVRGALDELAAFQAVERSDARSLRKIGSTHESFQREASLSVPNVERLVAKDVAFHRSIAQASGSELLVSLLDELADHITDSRRVTLVGRDARMSAKEHAAVVGAIERRDAPAAKEAAGAHVRSVRDWVEAALAEAPAL
jgi:DNA-binding FadR family transcriptional regulator